MKLNIVQLNNITVFVSFIQGSDSGTRFGQVPGLDKVFYMLMASDVVALLLLTRLVIGDIKRYRASQRISVNDSEFLADEVEA